MVGYIGMPGEVSCCYKGILGSVLLSVVGVVGLVMVGNCQEAGCIAGRVVSAGILASGVLVGVATVVVNVASCRFQQPQEVQERDPLVYTGL